MPAHRSNGFPYVQPDRHDELTDGAPATVQADAGHERTKGGQLAKGATTTPSKGGKSRKHRTKLSHDIDAVPVSDKLKRQARFMRRRTCTELARVVGGGECGIIASLFVKLASEDMALRESSLAGGDIDMARRLGESARMHLLYARETAAKDGKARAEMHDGADAPWLLPEAAK